MKPIITTLLLLGALHSQAQFPYVVYNHLNGELNPAGTLSYNGKLYFSSFQSSLGQELWSYDGSNDPINAFDLIPGPTSSIWPGYRLAAELNGKLYFGGNASSAVGMELMVYDGLNFPSLVADINPGSPASHPRLLTSINGKIYFTAELPGEGRELCVYDGVNAPVPVIINPGSNASDPDLYTELNGKVYFAATDNAKGRELRVYDPVTGVASLVADIYGGNWGGMVSGIVKWNSKIYFTANNGNHGCELYSYDGTSVVRLTDLTVGSASGASYMHAAYDGDIYFSGTEVGGSHYKLYKYNVSNNTTSLVADLDVREAIVYDGKLMMAADDGIAGSELWVHDGVSTTMLADIAQGPFGGLGSVSFCIHNNKLFFTANNGSSGNELYSLSNVAGLKNERFDASVTVFPNPATANATLSLSLKHPEILTISITDAVGKMVWTGEAISYATGIHNISLPISSFVPAVYCYNIINEQGKPLSSGKILKQ